MTEISANAVVLDASAILAWLQKEPGWELVDPQLERGVISTVNWSEVVQKVLERLPAKAPTLRSEIEALGVVVRSFSGREAEVAAALHRPSRPLGLSLADRVCLATGLTMEAPVMTADRAWKGITFPVPILLIR